MNKLEETKGEIIIMKESIKKNWKIYVIILLLLSTCILGYLYIKTHNELIIANESIKKLSNNPQDFGGVIDTSKIVYVTNSGKKYHKKNCSYLNNSSIATTLYCAESLKYGACSRCNP